MWICVDARPLQDKKIGGVQEYTKRLLDALLRLDKKNQYVLFTNASKGAVDLSRYLSANVFHADFRYPNKLFNLCLRGFGWPKLDTLIESKIKQETGKDVRSDIFWAPNINFIRLRPGTKFLLTVHDVSFFIEPSFFSLKQRLWHAALRPRALLKLANILLPVSESTFSDLKRFGFKNGEVIYAGVDERFFKRDEGAMSELKTKYNLPERFILTLAAFGKRKNLESVIRAFESARLPENMYLVIAGADTELLRHKRGENGRIRFLGAVSEELLPSLYHASEFFVYPSFYEGFGLPVLEAFASGTPVVTANSSSLSEVADGAALLVNPHDAAEIIKAMEMLASSENLRKKLIVKGGERAAAFSWDISAANLLAQFEKNKGY